MHDISVNGQGVERRETQRRVDSLTRLEDEDNNRQSCILPSLSRTNNVVGRLAEIAVPLNPRTQTTFHTSPTQTSIIALVQTAWSLVLTKYTGNESITFGYLQLSSKKSKDAKYVCRATIDAWETVQGVIDRFQHQLVSAKPQMIRRNCQKLSSEGETLFNSVILTGGDLPDGATNVQELFPNCDLIVSIPRPSQEKSIRIFCDPCNELDGLARNIAHTLGKALDAVINRRPDLLIEEINLLSDFDDYQIQEWNQNIPHAIYACVHETFHQTAKEHPASPAVSAWDGSLSYVELDTVTDRLAKHLRRLGVARGSFVPVCFEKSIWMTVSIISILKAGGAVVPLDASYPSKRLLEIIKDTKAELMLSGSQLVHIFQGSVPTIVSDLPTLVEKLTEDPRFVCGKVDPNDPAFVIFTSGSTGKPKGLVHTHSTICSSVAAYGPALNLTANSRVLQFAAYSFDISIIDTIATLIHGGCICVPSEHERLNDIMGFIQRSQANWAFLTPSFARRIDPGSVESLTTLVLGGEDVPQDSVQAWSSKRRRVMNGYGPAECTICVTEALHPDQRPVIGRGVGCRTWVVDLANYSKLAPLGCVGELCIEGPVVFQGYLNDEDKTSSAFLDSPLWLSSKVGPQFRLYKTGDLVKYNTQGKLVYMGRRDNQVKLRGQRVELGEVEHYIRSHIFHQRDIAVDVVNLANGGPTLAAFISTEDSYSDIQLLIQKVVNNLNDVLPAYMIPSAFIPIHELPMSKTGKLDRRKLQYIASELTIEQVISYGLAKRESQALSTALQRRLAALWAKVLNTTSTIGANDHFFVLGGDSLAAISLVSIARQNGLRISVAEIFQQPFLSDMALTLTVFVGNATSCKPFEMLPHDDSPALYTELVEQCRIPADDVEDIYPCTPLQEGVFALSVMHPGTYVAQMLYEIPIDVDQHRFEAAWDEVVQRNAVLRSRILHVGLRSYQIVTKSPQDLWQKGVDLETYLYTDKQRPMGNGDPLLRLAMFTSSPPRKFVVSMHHSIFDAWSLQLIWKEVAKAYKRQTMPRVLGFKNFIHFLDYENVSARASYEYWQEQLRSAIPSEFPAIPSGTYQPYTNASFTHRFSLSQTKSQNTLSVTIRAAWAMLLAQYSGSRDVTFGMTISGRFVPYQGIEELIGPTIATVPLRIRIDPLAPVDDFLAMVQKQATDMIPYEHTGLQAIAKCSSDAHEACKFSSLLIVHSVSEASSSDFQLLYEKETIAQFGLPNALLVECHLTIDGVHVTASYDSAILPDYEIERLMEQFEHVLRQLCRIESGVKVKDVELISPADMKNLVLWNKNLPMAEDVCIHQQIEAQALQNPSSEAVCAWDGALTYYELNQLSSHLAKQYVKHGIGAEVIVPLCFDKSKWVTVSLLAVLKAGGACLYLEPTWPLQRIDFILRSVNAAIVVAEPQYLSLFESKVPVVLALSSASFHGSVPDGLPPPLPLVRPSQAAFVMFTSGSTGTPKGIVQEHSALYTSARNHASTCNINSNSRVLQFSAFTFDVYIIEICTTLINGGCLCVPSEFDRMNNLAQVMEQMQVNWAFFTPTFCRSMEPYRTPHLRTLLVGGEAVDKATIDKWVDHVLLLNCYGPAECGPSVMCEITRTYCPETIGLPLCVVCWVADPDDHHKLAPIGAAGELLLEGYTMARCYLHEPEKTNASFVPAPQWLRKLGPSRGQRLYKTGDLVRYSKDGIIDFIGRKDTQVKVRGQRVELGEVEYHLRNCLPETTDVAAEVVRLSKGQERASLVAYVCLKSSELKGEARLLDECEEDYQLLLLLSKHLQEKMKASVPLNMIPAVVLLISRMPMNTSGKLDRKQLKSIASQVPAGLLFRSREDHNRNRVPETKMEIKLKEFWEKLLKPQNPVHAGDNFFHLGADSITAMALVALTQDAGLSLSVGQIFRHPVLSDLAAQVHAREVDSADLTVQNFELLPKHVNIQGIQSDVATACQVSLDSIEDIYPCTPLQEGLLALSLIRPGAYTSQNVYSVPLSVDLDMFRAAWSSTAHDYPILRTRVLQISYGVVQAIVLDPIEWHTQGDLEPYLKADKKHQITNGRPMARFALFPNTEGKKSHFVLTLHHSIYDKWSLKLLWEAVKRAYSGLRVASSPPFNRFIRHVLASDEEASKSFWRKQLEGANLTAFPEIQPGYQPSTTSLLTHRHACCIPHDRPHTEFTLSTLVRAAWSLLIARYSLAEDVTFGAIASGRTAPVNSIDSIVGPVLATVPIRARISYQEPLSVFLEQVQAQAVDMIPFEQTGLQNIKRYLESATQSVCDFQNLLVIQPMLDERQTFSEIICQSDASDFVVPHALVMECSLVPEGVDFQASFDPCVIKPESIRRIMIQFEHVLAKLAFTDPNTCLYDLDMLCAEDKHELILANSQVPQTHHYCVHEIIEMISRDYPEATAIDAWDGKMSYEHLDRLSNVLSAHLQTLGVKSGMTVPLLFEKSKWTIVALLGVMKTGAAFVLIDHLTSVRSLESIILAVDAQFALTSKTLLSQFEHSKLSNLVVVDDAEISKYSALIHDHHPVSVSPDSVIYINFTSGTTSVVPKAAIIQHAAYSTGAIAHAEAMGIDRDSRVLQFASYNFDGAILEILTPLMHGGCVCIPSERDRLDDIAGFMNSANITLAILTPTVARAAFIPNNLISLQTLILVGESMSREDVLRYKSPNLRLLNGYGLTECCVCCALLEMTEEGVGSIGRPIASNFWITNADDHDRLAPVGTVGELLIEGPILAQEYLNDVAKTNANFVINPPWSHGIRPMRLYKTGDLVRYNENGTLNLIGRRDMQVKLRGQRIDLTEAARFIKDGLGDNVADVACNLISPADDRQTPVLAAFVSFGQDSMATNSEVVAFAQKERLTNTVNTFKAGTLPEMPSHMIPTFYIPVSYMPLLPSGKVNQRKLMEIAGNLTAHQLAAFSSDARAQQKKPLEGMEIVLARFWARIFDIDDDIVEARDSFFLWGDSISAIRLTAMLRDEGFRLAAADIIIYPILSEMAKLVTVTRETGKSTHISAFALLEESASTIFQEVMTQCNLGRDAIADIYPTTPLQDGLMALSVKQQGSYIAQNVLTLPASLNVEKFVLAWTTVAEKNPILRTRIVQIGNGGGLQVVVKESTPWARGNDLLQYLESNQHTALGFGDALNYFAMIAEPGGNHFVWTSHHATYDGWSVDLLFRQVDRLYHGLDTDELLPFNVYIEHLTTRDSGEADSFWNSQAANGEVTAFPALPKAIYKPDPNKSLTYEIEIGRGSGLASTNLYAAWAFISGRYSDANEPVFGIVVNGRTVAVSGIDKVAGPTIATVPLCVRVERHQTVQELIRQIEEKSSTVAQFAYKGLQNIRKLSSGAEALCDFQTILIVQPESGAYLPCGTSISSESSQDLSSFNNYGLMLECKPGPRTLTVTASFDENLIETALMQRLLRQFGHVLKQIADSTPTTKLRDLSLATEEDIVEVMDYNLDLPKPTETLLHDLVTAQVEVRRDSTAVCAWDGQLSYQQLQSLSSSLAKYIVHDMNMKRGSIVPLAFERSMWTLVCLLAVLKAGGAVILLDPAYPLARSQGIIREAKADMVLCDPDFATRLSAWRTVVITPDFVKGLPDGESFSLDVQSQDPAFVISTSGSTGQPKLMVHTHMGISSNIMAYGAGLKLDSKSRILQFAAYSFDISINEMLAALIYGGCVCIPSEHDRMNNLIGFIRDMQVNWMFATPSFINHSGILPEDVPSLQTLVLGGEATSQDHLDVWKSNVNLLSAYGPAECQLCTVGPLTKPRDIGYPSGCVCWITDPDDINKLMPFGMIGELIVQGPVVAEGYLNAPETPFRVRPSWLPDHVTARFNIYRTGDLVKYDSRGAMTYIGRKDSQIKLRGQRIELADVEYHVRASLPETLSVAAEIINYENHPSLVVFISSAEAGKPLTKDTIHRMISVAWGKMSDVLPSYMVPKGFVYLDSLPLTVSGKIDRKSLKAMSISLEDLITEDFTEEQSAEPLSEEEHVLQVIWSQVLEVQRRHINSNSNFFKLGGDSISAIKLVRFAQLKNVHLTVANIFETPRLSAMAKLCNIPVRDDDPEPFSLLDATTEMMQQAAEQCRVFPDQIEDMYPCTPLQEGLFALSQRAGAYVARSIFKLPPELNLATFKSAWTKTSSMNAIIRTAIVQVSGQGLLQVVLKDANKWTEFPSFRGYLEQDEAMQLGDRLTRFTIAEGHFVISQHHATYDGYSLPQIFRQAEDLYRGGISMFKSAPYNRFVKYLIGRNGAESREFWTKEMSGATPSVFPLVPPNYQPRPSAYSNKEVKIVRSEATVTMSTYIQAAWALVVSSYSGARDVTFGVTLSGRKASIKNIEDINGPTIATVPMRVQVDPGLSTGEYLRRFQKKTVTMIPHEQAGLQHIMKLSPEAKSACEFQNILIIHPAPRASLNESSIHVPYDGALKDHVEFRTYTLNIECTIVDTDTIIAECFFDPNVIDNTQMTRTLSQFEHFVKFLSHAGSRPLKDVELINPQDKQEIYAWNAELQHLQTPHTSCSPLSATSDPPPMSCIHRLVEQRVISQADRPAVCSWDGDLNYASLESLAARLAYHLCRLGVGPETYVLLCFEKSLWMIVAILAVMKSGGCFVPLDPSYPKRRLLELSDQVKPCVVLASSKYAGFLHNTFEVTSLSIENLPAPPKKFYSNEDVRPNDALYTIFTSGSTGQPKGVMIEHRAFCIGANARSRLLRLSHESRVLQFSSYSFDVSMEDILSTLIAGGCVCIPSEKDRLDDLAHAIRTLRVNHANLTPSVASLLDPADVPGLRVLALGGEPLTETNIRSWSDHVYLANFYGPTECAVTVSINGGLKSHTNPRNIGRAVGCCSWIVDAEDHNKLAPIGSIGELLIEGPVLARGYLHAQAKTEAAFIENPEWAQAAKRLYKTGDLVRYDSDGSLTYIGRADESQIKIRGQRVELGEIEHHVRLAILEALTVSVDLLKRDSKSPILTAFIQTPSKISETALMSVKERFVTRLEQSLPPHMIPSVIVSVGTVPLTPAGKIDRRELRRLGSEMMSTGNVTYVNSLSEKAQEPSTDLERRVQKVWADVLNLSTSAVGVGTPFFNLGGDSITSIQVVGRCRAQKISVTTYDMLKHKTIAKICKNIPMDNLSDFQPALEELSLEEEFELSPIQREHFELMPIGNNAFQQSFLLQLSRVVSLDSIQSAVTKAVDSHPMLRSRFSRKETGRWVQRITHTSSESFFFRYCSQGDVERFREEIDCAVDIEKGPVLGIGIIDIGNTQMLYLTIHHLTVDLISWRVILHDLEEVLSAPEAELCQEPVTFPAWCRLQAEYTRTHLSGEQALSCPTPAVNLDYWTMGDTSNLYEDTTSDSFVLTREASSLILGKCNIAMRTEPVEIFLAAIFYSFGRSFPDREGPALFNESHGREPWDDLDLSRTVGWFTTMYPLNVDCSGDLADVIRRTKEKRRSVPSNGWSYFTSRHLSEKATGPAAAEIIFNYQGVFQQLERQDALFKLVPLETPSFSRQGTNVQRPSLFEISVGVHEKQLRFDFIFNRRMSQQTRIHDWIRSCQETLNQAALSLPRMGKQYSTDDFPLLPSDIQDFSRQPTRVNSQLSFELDDVYPCSPMQKLMFSSQNRGSRCYQVIASWKAIASEHDGKVDSARLQMAWQLLVDRYAILRTCVTSFHHHAVQIVLDEYQGDIVLFDKINKDWHLSLFDSLPPEAQSRRPMHRMSFCQVSAKTILCKLEMSHLLMDGASLSILLQELASAYDGSWTPSQETLPYKELVRHIQTARRGDSIEYWQNYLKDATPCNYPSNPTQPFVSSSSVDVNLSDLQSELHPFCRKHGITLSTLFQTVWSLVLRLYTKTNDICFGYLVSGRDIPLKGISQAIGPYFNLLCCRIDLNASMTTLDALEAIHADSIRSVRYQDFSLPEIEELDAPRLFNTLINFRKYAVGGDAGSKASIAFESVEAYDPFDYDIVVGIAERMHEASVVLTYWKSRIPEEQATAVAATFRDLLSRMLRGMHGKISDLDQREQS